jgi:hypothetical protein
MDISHKSEKYGIFYKYTQYLIIKSDYWSAMYNHYII